MLSLGTSITAQQWVGQIGPVASTASFGTKTLSGAGGVALPSGATSITDADGTNLTVTSGDIVPATDGVTAGTLTFDNGATMTVSTFTGLTVKDDAELEAAAESTSVAFGDEIVLRAGIYNPSKTDRRIRRPSDPTGTWDGSNYVVIKSEGIADAVIRRLSVDAQIHADAYLRFTNLSFDCDLNGVDETALRVIGGVGHILIDTCFFSGTANPARINSSDLCDGILVNNASANNILIHDNLFTDVDRPVALQGPDHELLRNTMERFWGDGAQFIDPCPRLKANYNVLKNKRSGYRELSIVSVTEGATTQIEVTDATGIANGYDLYITGTTGLDEVVDTVYNISNVSSNTLTVDVNTSGATPWVSGGVIRWTSDHGDGFQGVFNGASDGDLDDIEICGNLIDTGDSTPILADMQAIFLTNNASSAPLRNLKVEGNTCIVKMVNGILLNYPLNASIRNNMAISQYDGGPGTTVINVVGTLAGNVVTGNIANAYSISGVSFAAGNHTLAFTQVAYEDAFVSPDLTETEADTVANYTPRTGGALDLLSPVPGAIPAQDYDSPYTFTAGSYDISLTSPLGAADGATAATGGATTDAGLGTLYWVTTTSATSPSGTQIKAGQDHTGAAAADDGSQSVTATGAQVLSPAPTGLTAETDYYNHYYQESGSLTSNVVTSAVFTTGASAPATFVTNGAYFSDPSSTPASTTVVEAIMRFKLPTGGSGIHYWHGQTGDFQLGIDGSSELRINRIEDPGDGANAHYDTTDQDTLTDDTWYTLRSVIDMENGTWQYQVDGVDVYNAAFNVTSPPTSPNFKSTAINVCSYTNSGSGVLPSDTEIEYIELYYTTSGVRSLHKRISVAEQGSIAGINADAWHNGGSVTAA